MYFPTYTQEQTAAQTSIPVKQLTREQLQGELQYYRQLKCWGSIRYLAVDRELQDRAVRAWRTEDVFGNTFSDGGAQ